MEQVENLCKVASSSLDLNSGTDRPEEEFVFHQEQTPANLVEHDKIKAFHAEQNAKEAAARKEFDE